MKRSICVTVAASTAAEARRIRESCGNRADYLELRADHLTPDEVSRGDWCGLPTDEVAWVFTWRSPAEGGVAGGRPPGILDRALEAGFTAVDVEAKTLARDPEGTAVPPGQRWVSAHFDDEPADEADWESRWAGVAGHQAALHKLVVSSGHGGVTRAVLKHVDILRAEGASAFAVFAQGAAGHASRILGGLRGNAVTFAAPPDLPGAAPGQPDLAVLVDAYRFRDQPSHPPVYGVLGYPALHSLSPRMHNAALARESLEGIYLPLECEDPAPVFEDVRNGVVRGLSVTAPHKMAAAAAAEERSSQVELTGAANTLWLEQGRLTAANTDVGAGRRLLADLGVAPGSRVAVLGSGGAAAAVCAAVMELGATGTVFSRNRGAGESLATRFDSEWGGSLEGLVPGDHHVVVNATPLGRENDLPVCFRNMAWPGAGILDLVYAPQATGFERLAREHDLPFRGGREFLVTQGSEQFRLWHGRTPDAAVLEEALA